MKKIIFIAIIGLGIQFVSYFVQDVVQVFKDGYRRIKEIESHTYRVLSQAEILRLYGEWYRDNIILQDENGKNFIVKTIITESEKTKIEKFMYLLAQNVVNVAEVRTIEKKKLRELSIPYADINLAVQNLPLVRMLQDYRIDELIQQTGSREGLFVFYILTRMSDHRFDLKNGVNHNISALRNWRLRNLFELELISFDHSGFDMLSDIFLRRVRHGSRNIAFFDIVYYFSFSALTSDLNSLFADKSMDLYIIARKVKEFQDITDSELKQKLSYSGFEGVQLESAINILKQLRDRLKEDTEIAIERIAGKKVNLSDYLR